MQILKVLNNSLILAIDNTGSECILMGKGIGYNQAIGNILEESQVEKVFLLKDKTVLRNFVQLASEIDETYFNLVKEIIEYAHDLYQMEVMDYLYLSLSDHIAFAVRRLEERNVGENFNYIEIVKRHKEEYDVGKFGIHLINQRLGVNLPESEASAIGLHFVNAKLNSQSFQKEQDLVKLIKNIETIVSRTLNIAFDRDSFSYSRFITHLNYFAERIIEGKLFEDNQSDILFDSMKVNMPKENQVIDNIGQFILTKHEIQISKQEKIYLMVHLHRIVAENHSDIS